MRIHAPFLPVSALTRRAAHRDVSSEEVRALVMQLLGLSDSDLVSELHQMQTDGSEEAGVEEAGAGGAAGGQESSMDLSGRVRGGVCGGWQNVQNTDTAMAERLCNSKVVATSWHHRTAISGNEGGASK